MTQDDAFLRELILAEEDLPSHARQSNSNLRYRSPNVYDLWQHRSQQERARVTERIKVRLAVSW